eukprot:m.65565 g.65565  ORF g.65565 m.65565 type:complete len:243 (-) comp7332_c1_seq1:104-832(-)
MASVGSCEARILLEESPELETLRDCFSYLKLTPPDLVKKHAALVKSCDTYDCASVTYPYFNDAYVFVCWKENNFFSKDRARIKVYLCRNVMKSASPTSVAPPPYTPVETVDVSTHARQIPMAAGVAVGGAPPPYTPDGAYPSQAPPQPVYAASYPAPAPAVMAPPPAPVYMPPPVVYAQPNIVYQAPAPTQTVIVREQPSIAAPLAAGIVFGGLGVLAAGALAGGHHGHHHHHHHRHHHHHW